MIILLHNSLNYTRAASLVYTNIINIVKLTMIRYGTLICTSFPCRYVDTDNHNEKSYHFDTKQNKSLYQLIRLRSLSPLLRDISKIP